MISTLQYTSRIRAPVPVHVENMVIRTRHTERGYILQIYMKLFGFDAKREKKRTTAQRSKGDRQFVERQNNRITKRKSDHTKGIRDGAEPRRNDKQDIRFEDTTTKGRRRRESGEMRKEIETVESIAVTGRELFDSIEFVPIDRIISEVIPLVDSTDIVSRVDVALLLAARGDAAFVFAHLNDTFAEVERSALARALIENGSSDVLVQHLHHFPKQSLSVFEAGSLLDRGYREEVMQMPGIFSCSLDALRYIADTGFAVYVDKEKERVFRELATLSDDDAGLKAA